MENFENKPAPTAPLPVMLFSFHWIYTYFLRSFASAQLACLLFVNFWQLWAQWTSPSVILCWLSLKNCTVFSTRKMEIRQTSYYFKLLSQLEMLLDMLYQWSLALHFCDWNSGTHCVLRSQRGTWGTETTLQEKHQQGSPVYHRFCAMSPLQSLPMSWWLSPPFS